MYGSNLQYQINILNYPNNISYALVIENFQVLGRTPARPNFETKYLKAWLIIAYNIIYNLHVSKADKYFLTVSTFISICPINVWEDSTFNDWRAYIDIVSGSRKTNLY